MINFIPAPSPNWEMRDKASPQFIIIHYTDTANLAETFAILQNPQTKLSSHVVIDENGDIYRLVDDDKTAWHAGASYWRGVRNLNHQSLGIELQHGGVRYPAKDGKPDQFAATQIAALKKLLRHWCDGFSIVPENIIAHSDIAPGRKIDPGPTFPWQSLVDENLAQDMTAHKNIMTMDDAAAHDALVKLGYDPGVDGATLKKTFALRLGKTL